MSYKEAMIQLAKLNQLDKETSSVLRFYSNNPTEIIKYLTRIDAPEEVLNIFGFVKQVENNLLSDLDIKNLVDEHLSLVDFYQADLHFNPPYDDHDLYLDVEWESLLIVEDYDIYNMYLSLGHNHITCIVMSKRGDEWKPLHELFRNKINIYGLGIDGKFYLRKENASYQQ